MWLCGELDQRGHPTAHPALTHSFHHERLHIDMSKCYLWRALPASASSLLPQKWLRKAKEEIKVAGSNLFLSSSHGFCVRLVSRLSPNAKMGQTDQTKLRITQNTCEFTTPLSTGRESCTCLVHAVLFCFILYFNVPCYLRKLYLKCQETWLKICSINSPGQFVKKTV